MAGKSNEEIIHAHFGRGPIDLAMVLGSGLAGLLDEVEGPELPYDALERFPAGGVSGHSLVLKIGELEGRRVALLGGREHYYEAGRAGAMREPIRLLHALGARRLLLTNAAGSLHADMPPGSVMCLSDHVNLSGANPLIGEEGDARFVSLVDAYSPVMRKSLRGAASRAGVELFEGIYVWWSGPSFETPAEIRMLQRIGGDAVGMSTVPEVILARFFGMEVAAISVITNHAAGLSDENISHEHTKAMAPIGAEKLKKLLRDYLRGM